MELRVFMSGILLVDCMWVLGFGLYVELGPMLKPVLFVLYACDVYVIDNDDSLFGMHD